MYAVAKHRDALKDWVARTRLELRVTNKATMAPTVTFSPTLVGSTLTVPVGPDLSDESIRMAKETRLAKLALQNTAGLPAIALSRVVSIAYGRGNLMATVLDFDTASGDINGVYTEDGFTLNTSKENPQFLAINAGSYSRWYHGQNALATYYSNVSPVLSSSTAFSITSIQLDLWDQSTGFNGLTYTFAGVTAGGSVVTKAIALDQSDGFQTLTFGPEFGNLISFTLPAYRGSEPYQFDNITLDAPTDTVAPTVASVGVPATGTYVAGQNLDFTVTMSESVTVDTAGGTPALALTLDTGGTVQANYLSGSGSDVLTFRYTVVSGNLDANGVAVASSITSNGGAIRDVVGNNATLTLNNVGSTAGVHVDAVAPTVTSVAVPASGTYLAGQNLDFTVTMSEAVTVNTAGGTPTVALTLDTGGTVQASYLSGSGSDVLTFRYTVASGNLDADGVAVASTIVANGGTIADAAGNNAGLTLANVGSTTSVHIDAVAPTLTSSAPGDNAIGVSSNTNLVLNFSETVERGTGTIEIHAAGGALIESFDAATSTRLTFSGSSLTIDPTSDLPAGSGVYVTVASGAVEDIPGNPFGGITTSTGLNFTTAAASSAPRPDPFVITGGPDPDLIQNDTSGRNIIFGRGGNDTIYASFGDDSVYAEDGDDQAYGGPGNDQVYGGPGNDTVGGGTGNDTVGGGPGDDFVYGADGDDQLYGADGNDNLQGGAGNDTFVAGNGDDSVYGGDGHDIVYGFYGNDLEFGGAGNDTLFGGPGADTLWGGAGDDVMWGGADGDRFAFANGSGNDQVFGFNAAEGDRLDLQGQTYTLGSNGDGDAVLTLSGGGVITLEGLNPASLNSMWFV